jgi:hypothetical protein
LVNRRAALYFLEAQIRWQSDRSRASRRYAHELAKESLLLYRDWDAGAESSMQDVEKWLKSHPV